MRVLTHNSLKCPLKSVTLGYPLQIEVQDMQVMLFCLFILFYLISVLFDLKLFILN